MVVLRVCLLLLFAESQPLSKGVLAPHRGGALVRCLLRDGPGPSGVCSAFLSVTSGCCALQGHDSGTESAASTRTTRQTGMGEWPVGSGASDMPPKAALWLALCLT